MGHDSARCNDAGIAQDHIFQNNGLRTDPTSVANAHTAGVHRNLGWIDPWSITVIAIRDEYIGAEKTLIADFDEVARVDYDVSIEVIMGANSNVNSTSKDIAGQKPASLRKGVFVSNFDFAAISYSRLAFDAVMFTKV